MDRELAKLFENIVASSTSVPDFYKKFNSCVTYTEKIRFIKEFYEWDAPEYEAEYRKDAVKSSEFREFGNRAYVLKDFEGALIQYNLALHWAPIESKELGLAFANRSVVLQAQRKLRQALTDANRAIQHAYPENLLPKLNARIEKCNELLHQEMEIKNAEVTEERQRRKNFCDKELFNLRSPNRNITYAEDFVQIRQNNEFGRHVVVTKDVPPGTVLIVEDPFVFTLKNEMEESTTHCSNCLKLLQDGGIPCTGCTFAFYCDETCRFQSESNFHKYECPCLPLIRKLELPPSIILATRIICKVGPEQLLSIFKCQDSKFKNASDLDSKNIPGFDPETKVYDSSTYLTVYHLIADHGGERSDIESVLAALQALAVANILVHSSEFFINFAVSEEVEFQNFIAGLILQHFYTISSNSMSLHEIPYTPALSDLTGADLAFHVKSLQFRQVGTGLYALTSLLNHSCDPNVARINNLTHGTMSVISLKPLRAGDQLFNCYSTFFGTASLNERQNFLKANYNFKCRCSPCTEDWPLLFALSRSKMIGFTCPKCPSYCLVPTPDKKSGRCKNCKQKYPLSIVTTKLKTTVEKFQEAYKLTLQNKVLEAVSPICESLSSFHTCIKQPFVQTFVAQETFKQALGIIVSSTNAL